jgi:hypothetical protein
VFQLASTWQRSAKTVRIWLLTLGEWPLWLLLGSFMVGALVVGQQPLHYTINLGYEEGWHSDQPLIAGWNTAEPRQARPDELSYRWSGGNSLIRLPGLGRQPLIVGLEQLPATANPQVSTGQLYLSGAQMAVSQSLVNARTLHLLLPPATAEQGLLHISAPAFTPPNDPRTLGAPIGGLELRPTAQSLRFPPLSLFWPLLMLPLAWISARRWCVSQRDATIGGMALVVLLLAALAGDRLRFALAGGPLLLGALWGLIVGLAALWLMERYAERLGVAPSAWFTRLVALLVCWLMLLRYGGRLYPDSMVGDLGFHVNRQTDVIRGLVLLTSRHRGIDFPYPSAVYVLLAPLRLLPIAPQTLVEWFDALFGALGILPIAYIGLRGLRSERSALLATAVYALLAPAMMALWWSFLAHIFTQEAVALLVALVIGCWQRLDRPRNIALITVGLCLVFFGHFGLFINISVLFAGLLPLLWWRYRSSPHARQVYGLLIAFVLAELLALGLFYSAYLGLILTKLAEFQAGGMSQVQGGRAEIGWQALALSLWRDGLVAHYAIIGVPLALLGGYWLWQQQHGQILVWLFWGTVAVAVVQGTIPFITASTITTRWLSFCAWVIAIGSALVLEWLWRRGRVGQSLVIAALVWIGGNTMWLWVKALGYRIRPPEPF